MTTTTYPVQYYWPPDVDSGHSGCLTVWKEGLLLPRLQTPTAFKYTAGASGIISEAIEVENVSGLGFVGATQDGSGNAWLLGYYGDVTYVPGETGQQPYTIPSAVSGDVFAGATFCNGYPYFASANGDLLTVSGGSVTQVSPGFGERVASITSDGSKLYAALPDSGNLATYTLSTPTSGSVAKTSTPMPSPAVVAANSSSYVGVAGWAPSTIVSGAASFQINGVGNLVAAANTSANRIFTLGGTEPDWSLTAAVSGTGAPVYLSWASSGEQVLVTDATNNKVQVFNLQAGALVAGQVLTVSGAGQISVTPDGVTALVCQPSHNQVTVLTNNLNTWSVAQTITGLTTPTSALVLSTTTAVIGSSGDVTWFSKTASWTAGTVVSGLGFTPNGLATNGTGTIYAAGGSGTGQLAVLTTSGLLTTNATWSGSGDAVYFEQAQIAVADKTNALIHVFANVGSVLSSQGTVTAPAGISAFGYSDPSVWLCGACGIWQYVFTSPFNLVTQKSGQVSVYHSGTFHSASLLVGHQPSAAAWDVSGSVWFATLQNDLNQYSNTCTIEQTIFLQPDAISPASVYPSLGISALTWWENGLYASSAQGQALLQCSGTAIAPPIPVAPTAPTGLQASNIAGTTLTLSWNAPFTGNELNYQVQYRETGQTSWTNFNGLLQTTSANITGLVALTSYDFQVTASNTAGSATSAVYTVATIAGALGPSAPTGLAASSVQSTSLTLTWNASTGTAPISYQPQYRLTGQQTWNNLPGGTTTNTFVNVSSLIAATSYQFQVIASNTAGTATSGVLTQTTGPASNTATTWNPNDVSGMTLNATLLTATTNFAGTSATEDFAGTLTTTQPWTSHQVWQSGDLFEYSVPGQPGGSDNGSGTWWVNPISTPGAASLYTQTANGLQMGLMVNPGNLGISATTDPRLGTIINTQNTPGGVNQLFGYWEFSAALPAVNGFMLGFDIEDLQHGDPSSSWTAELDIFLWFDANGAPNVQFKDGYTSYIQGTNVILYSTTSLDITQVHKYGIDWQQDFITCYIDGVQVGTPYANPGGAYLTNPMNALIYTNDASYIGSAGTSASSLPAHATVAYLDVWSTYPSSNGGVSGVTQAGVRTNTSRNSGLVYYEMGLNTSNTNETIGLANSSWSETAVSGVGRDGNSIGLNQSGTVYFNGAALAHPMATWPAAGGTIGIAANLNTSGVWFTYDGSNWNATNSGANPATGVSGYSFSGLTGPVFGAFGAAEGSGGTANTLTGQQANGLNLNPNYNMTGGTVGTTTLPTGWSQGDDTSCKMTLYGQGTLANGVPYVDIQVSGTSGSSSFDTLVVVAPGMAIGAVQTTMACSTQLISGSFPSGAGLALVWNQYNSTGGYINTVGANITTTGTLSESIVSVLNPAGTAQIEAAVQVYYNPSTAINVVFRVAGIQLGTEALPIIVGPTAATVGADSSQALNAFTIYDATETGTFTLNASCTNGTLSITAGTVTGNGTAALQASDTFANIQTAINTLIYTAGGAASSDTITIQLTDSGGSHQNIPIAVTIGSASSSAKTINTGEQVFDYTIPSGFSAYDSFVPNGVTNLQATPNSTSVLLTWNAPNAGTAQVTSLIQYRETGTQTWTTAATNVVGTSYTVQGLINGTSYDFEVYATNQYGDSGTAPLVTTTTTSAPVKGISISTIPQQSVNQSFTVLGSLTNYTSAPTLQYRDNGTGSWNAFPAGATVTSSSFSFTHPAFGATGTDTVGVRDANSTSTTALSNSFQIAQSGTGPSVTGNLMADFGTKTGITVYPELFGVATGGMQNNNYSVCSNATFQNLVSALNLPLLRLHGQWLSGTTYTYSDWSNFVTNVTHFLPSSCTIVLGFGNPAGGTVPTTGQMQAMVSGAATDWKNNAPAGYNIAYWEGPNEPNPTISAAQQASLCAAISAGARSVFPNALAAGPTSAGGNGPYTAAVVSALSASTLGLLDTHQYLWCQCCGDGKPSDQQVCAGQTQSGINAAVDAFQVTLTGANGTYAQGLPILLGEYNIEACAAGADNRASTAIGACYMCSELLDLAAGIPNNACYGGVWDLYDDFEDGYNLIDISFNTYPEYWMLKQLIATMPGDMVSATSNISGMKMWAIVNGTTTIGVAIVNTNASAVNSQVALSRWPINGSGNASIHQWQISPTTLQGAVTTITVQGGMTPSIAFPGESVTILYP